jgi:hypothetical protein
MENCNSRLEEAEYKTMPLAAKKIFKDHQELNTTNIIKLLNDEYKKKAYYY